MNESESRNYPNSGQFRTGLVWAIAAVGVLSLIGMALLWPRGTAPDLGTQPTDYVDATVTQVETVICDAAEADLSIDCQRSTVQLTSGPERGRSGEFLVRSIDFAVPAMHVGDRVVLLDVKATPPPYRYSFSDFQRSSPMWVLLAAFGLVVLAFGRWQGLRALLGLAVSGLLLVAFIVPAVLRAEPAVLVALTGTVVIAYLALYLAHGLNIGTTVALAGTLASLTVTVALALGAVSIAHLTGLADEQAQVLRVTAGALDLRGLLIAGIVVGALGVLDDVTVTQVSTVVALRRARPDLSRVALYREASRVGRDHIASTVNTLVLAYAGAALPLLLFFAQGSKPVGRILTSEIVAVEIVRMLVGSIGLVLSVPLTTALAAVVMSGDDDDGHADHGHDIRTSSSRDSEIGQRPLAWDDFAPVDDQSW